MTCFQELLQSLFHVHVIHRRSAKVSNCAVNAEKGFSFRSVFTSKSLQIERVLKHCTTRVLRTTGSELQQISQQLSAAL